MNAVVDYLMQDGIPLLDKTIRTAIVYLVLLVGMRLAGKRELGEMSTFDFVLILLLASAVETSIQAGDESVFGGLFAFVLLLAFNKIFAWVNFHFPKMRPVLEGDAVELVRDGEFVGENLRKELISQDEIRMMVKQNDIDGIEDVASFVLEVDGTASITRKGDTPELAAIKDIRARLDALEAHLRGAPVP
ncbi:MAG TPA: YetF domain-containing protein [Thermomicrobiales bacterium]|nr:YetF domain-containing protein [Thermomicrobiales bacterium]